MHSLGRARLKLPNCQDSNTTILGGLTLERDRRMVDPVACGVEKHTRLNPLNSRVVYIPLPLSPIREGGIADCRSRPKERCQYVDEQNAFYSS